MKTIVFVLGLVSILYSNNLIAGNCDFKTRTTFLEITGDSIIYRGEKITAEGAISTDELLKKMKKVEGKPVKIETTINSCCQKKGCWMKVDLGNGEEMRVTFKDYGFFVPKNSAGLKVIMEGKAYYEITTVEMLRHFAEDAGKSKKEIEAITEPKEELLFESTGLIIYYK